MGTQRRKRRREDVRTPNNSYRSRQAANVKKRHAQTRSAHRQVRRLGAQHVIELEVLAAPATPESEG